MTDPLDQGVELTEDVQDKIETYDRCNTLYTLWTSLEFRGTLNEKYLYTCRNDSSVVDLEFEQFAKSFLGADHILVNRGEVFFMCELLEHDIKLLVQSELELSIHQL